MVPENDNNNDNDNWGTPHAFHLNLPPNHLDPQDGVPYITKFAHKKARMIVDLALSIKLTEEMFVQKEVESMDIDDNVEMEQEGEASKETLVSIRRVLCYGCIVLCCVVL